MAAAGPCWAQRSAPSTASATAVSIGTCSSPVNRPSTKPGGVESWRGLTDADPQPGHVLGAETFQDVGKPLLPSCRTAFPEPQSAEGRFRSSRATSTSEGASL
ncbi:MAG: hypothetical protein CM1200mP2_40360 [Planctomycetaceae bacterium]|nr:MAG: hypothetical protein CM1200mP2_40360 [Planctomycetaceae bacterium]